MKPRQEPARGAGQALTGAGIVWKLDQPRIALMNRQRKVELVDRRDQRCKFRLLRQSMFGRQRLE